MDSMTMVMLMEAATCVAVIAGAAMATASQYRKLRAMRRCNEALRRTLCSTFAD